MKHRVFRRVGLGIIGLAGAVGCAALEKTGQNTDNVDVGGGTTHARIRVKLPDGYCEQGADRADASCTNSSAVRPVYLRLDNGKEEIKLNQVVKITPGEDHTLVVNGSRMVIREEASLTEKVITLALVRGLPEADPEPELKPSFGPKQPSAKTVRADRLEAASPAWEIDLFDRTDDCGGADPEVKPASRIKSDSDCDSLSGPAGPETQIWSVRVNNDPRCVNIPDFDPQGICKKIKNRDMAWLEAAKLGAVVGAVPQSDAEYVAFLPGDYTARAQFSTLAKTVKLSSDAQAVSDGFWLTSPQFTASITFDDARKFDAPEEGASVKILSCDTNDEQPELKGEIGKKELKAFVDGKCDTYTLSLLGGAQTKDIKPSNETNEIRVMRANLNDYDLGEGDGTVVPANATWEIFEQLESGDKGKKLAGPFPSARSVDILPGKYVFEATFTNPVTKKSEARASAVKF